MEIRTKFKPKDKAWVLNCITGAEYKENNVRQTKVWCVADEPSTISYIIIQEGITYYTTDMEYYSEQDCFATKEEAQKECDRRNAQE